MILQSLNQFFDRIQAEEDNPYGVPTPGYSVQNITFRIVLNPDGSLVDIQDAREVKTEPTKTGKPKTRFVPRQMLVPGEGKPPGSGINPCTLWDNTSYLLGYKKPDKNAEKAAKEAIRAQETLAATRDHYAALANEFPCAAFTTISAFYKSHWTAENAIAWKDKLDDFAATGFGIFRIVPDLKDTHDCETIRVWWKSRLSSAEPSSDETSGICLVTGRELPIARLHDPAIKGVNGAAPGGAKLASFEKHAFRSYAKDQSFNAPVSNSSVFAYCNALNALLSGPLSNRHRVTIGDVTAIFWTERKTTTESIFAQFIKGEFTADAEVSTVEDQAKHLRLEALLQILRRGGGAKTWEFPDDPNTKFFLLGLSGNVTRLVVRFWHVSTIGQMLENLADHYRNLALTCKKDRHHHYEPEFPSAQRLLDQTVRVQGGNADRKAISPLLGGQLMQSILHRGPYPMTLLQGVLNRLRANDPVDYLKAAILKSILIRNFNQSIEMSLNTERTEPAYLLGRLFAALEKTQEDALGKLNAGIRERFYSSASATPGSVFPRILRTYQHHLAKLEGGSKTNRERLIQAIHAPLNGYPSHLNLEEQGLFAIGYYHQRQDFFTKKEKPATEETFES